MLTSSFSRPPPGSAATPAGGLSVDSDFTGADGGGCREGGDGGDVGSTRAPTGLETFGQI